MNPDPRQNCHRLSHLSEEWTFLHRAALVTVGPSCRAAASRQGSNDFAPCPRRGMTPASPNMTFIEGAAKALLHAERFPGS